jgi:thiol-disulfide isomerase/thioredoxin
MRSQLSLPFTRPSLQYFGPAPELVGKIWLNVEHPVRLADLRGRVVLIDMWTFGCIACQRSIESLRGWHEKYFRQGFQVIGNHFPEFARETELESLKMAVKTLGIRYPVLQDNEGVNWRLYGSRNWPTLYLVDKHGHLRYQHAGEGNAAQTEAAIRQLLAEPFV